MWEDFMTTAEVWQKGEYMKKTAEHNIQTTVLAVDINGLMIMLSCGEPTAKEIGEKSKARVQTNSKRVLYSIEKIKDYLKNNSY